MNLKNTYWEVFLWRCYISFAAQQLLRSAVWRCLDAVLISSNASDAVWLVLVIVLVFISAAESDCLFLKSAGAPHDLLTLHWFISHLSSC